MVLLYRLRLPILPEGLGAVAGPHADDPDAEDDWASGSYGRMETGTGNGQWTTFDEVRTTHHPDGTGDARYFGNRGVSGPGWTETWYEESNGEVVENESYHMPVAYHDDQPNSYDETIPHDSPESGEIPTPYHEPPALQPTTPTGGAMGPGGISAPEDPSEVEGLRNQVADDASMAYETNAVNDQAIVALTQTTATLGHPEDPNSQASENSLQGAATMADYAGSQSSLPDSANPAAIAAGTTASVEQPSTDQPVFFGRLKQLVLGSGEPSQAALRAEELRQRNREMQRNSSNASLRAQMGFVDQEGMQRSLDGIDTAGEYVKGAVLTAIDQTPIGIALALREAATGSDIEGNGVSRPLAGVRLLLSRFPGSRFSGSPVARVVNKVDDIGDGGRAFTKGHAFAKAQGSGFNSFSALKRAIGPAGEGRHWHHIVEQSKVSQFDADAIHHVDNVISVPAPVHHRNTGFYNLIQDFTNGQTVFQWLNGQSFEFQREFGMDILRRLNAL